MIMKTKSTILIAILVIGVILIGGCIEEKDTQAGKNESPALAKDPFVLWEEQPNGKIVFLSKADSPESGELYLLDKSGQITRLTDNNRHENNPALSPDGKKVAFHGGDVDNPLTWDIYVIDLETKEETRLTNNNILQSPMKCHDA